MKPSVGRRGCWREAVCGLALGSAQNDREPVSVAPWSRPGHGADVAVQPPVGQCRCRHGAAPRSGTDAASNRPRPGTGAGENRSRVGVGAAVELSRGPVWGCWPGASPWAAAGIGVKRTAGGCGCRRGAARDPVRVSPWSRPGGRYGCWPGAACGAVSALAYSTPRIGVGAGVEPPVARSQRLRASACGPVPALPCIRLRSGTGTDENRSRAGAGAVAEPHRDPAPASPETAREPVPRTPVEPRSQAEARRRRKSPVKGVCAAVWDPSTAAESGHGRGYL